MEDELLREFPESHPKSTLFPSGAAMLDVTVGNETYVLEYHLDVGLGISRVSTAVFGWEGYEHPVDDFEEARKFLIAALNEKASIVTGKAGAVLVKQEPRK
ncbi:MAG TPA: hypothetical protein VFC46_07290 [Humisphaera sp.]|nr:hypothetical protein [Humisphaera sp.]